MAIARWIAVVASAILAAFVWIRFAHETTTAPKVAAARPTYRCPMHPNVLANEPGECPVCHMDLVPIAEPTAGAYTCPMHPEIHASEPGRCPICKMPLEPVDAGAGGPPGTVPITLGVDRIQAIGVRTALAEEGKTAASLRISAVVEPAEPGASEVHVRTPGFVESVLVAETGREVRAGQPLFTLYSPEILQAQHELLTTQAWGDASPVAPGASRTKLLLLGMAEPEIERVVARREPARAITIAAPRGGFVTKKNVILGGYVTPEMILYELQDLSRVYVVANVALRDLPNVATGTAARFVPASHPRDAAEGTIDLVYPVVTPEARTRRVRMVLRNRGTYVPGEYGTVEIAAPERTAVTIPRDALVDTGTATYVFVVEAEGRFVPRTVVVAGSEAERVLVGDGLRAGERVVSGATFLIDSESRLRAAVQP